jgi:signal transduction histidine kinase
VLDGTAGVIGSEQVEFLTIAKRNVDRLARLINDVLDFQKLESGAEEFLLKENNLNEVVVEVQKTMSALVYQKGLRLTLKLSENMPIVRFNRDRIIQVLTNLVNNAVKFTESGEITVTTSFGGNFVQASIRDTGPGISEEDISKLFHDFSQLGIDGERKTGGTGLGLAISKEIIDRHRGKIWVESKIGEGSVFSFILPIAERRSRHV